MFGMQNDRLGLCSDLTGAADCIRQQPSHQRREDKPISQ
jgi:hypothetical protein